MSDGVDVGDEVIALRERPCELDLQVLLGLANADTVVLGEALEQLDALLQHAVPRSAVRILELAVLVGGPFAEQHGCGVLSPEVRGQGLLEGATEEHGGAGVFLPPAVEVAIPVAARAAEVLADLGVAVGHQATSDPVFIAGSGTQFRPLAGRSEAVEVEQGSAVDGGVADLDHAAESGEGLLVDLVASEQVRVVEEIAQEPAELPQSFRGAIHAPGDDPPSEFARLKDGEPQDVEGLRRMPAVLGAIDANKEHAVGHSISTGLGGLTQALDSTCHAAPSLFSPRGR